MSFNPNFIPHTCTLMQRCIMHSGTNKVVLQTKSSKRGFSMKGHMNLDDLVAIRKVVKGSYSLDLLKN